MGGDAWFVGREDELAVLGVRLEQALGGHGTAPGSRGRRSGRAGVRGQGDRVAGAAGPRRGVRRLVRAPAGGAGPHRAPPAGRLPPGRVRGSSHPAGPVSLAQQAAQARRLPDHLGIGAAQVVGHSSGANIAMRLALDTPDRVHSLAPLEPALLAVPTGPFGAEAFGRYQAGAKAGAIHPGRPRPGRGRGRHLLRPGAARRARVGDQRAGRRPDDPAGPGRAGERSHQVTPRVRPAPRAAGLAARAEPFVLAGATHLLQLQNPAGLAAGLAGFFARHPAPVAAGG
jgi:pimeloyl-ACP methyl ester carboxylesterase